MPRARSPVTWVTSQLAVGSAPMSHAHLDRLRRAGITAILNLCGEYCDLHEIEEEEGFEVHYLPIADEQAPDLDSMEQALAWLDEALYLGKKVLIHCRHGIGRTGTMLNAYLLRKGLGHKMAAKVLRDLKSKPANFEQWWTVRKYGRQSGRLTVREPSLEFNRAVDLAPFLEEYMAALKRTEAELTRLDIDDHCGLGRDECCRTPIRMTLVEAVHLSRAVNLTLSSETRSECIKRAAEVARKEKEQEASLPAPGAHCLFGTQALCPLSRDKHCLIFDQRPLQCRSFGLPDTTKVELWSTVIAPLLDQTSADLFFALTGCFPPSNLPLFTLPDVVSGRYVSEFFHLIKGCLR
jgi:predicted protein tyrosine phosphatase/Fe-S-cluster containining protein